MVSDLTGLPVANCVASGRIHRYAPKPWSWRSARGEIVRQRRFFVDENCHPQNIAVVQYPRLPPLGIEVIVGAPEDCPAEPRFPAALLPVSGRHLLGDLRDFSQPQTTR